MIETVSRTSLQELARAELSGLYAFARHLCHSEAEAEDLVQDTFLRATRKFHTLEDVKAGPKWLRTIMLNLWRNGLRSKGRRPDEIAIDPFPDEHFSLYRTLSDEDPFPWSDTMHVDFLGRFSTEDIHLVLHRLDDRYRVPLTLRYVEGFDTNEIAEMLDQPPGTVYSNLYRGRERFEKGLWEYAEESDLIPEDAAERPEAKEAAWLA